MKVVQILFKILFSRSMPHAKAEWSMPDGGELRSHYGDTVEIYFQKQVNIDSLLVILLDVGISLTPCVFILILVNVLCLCLD